MAAKTASLSVNIIADAAKARAGLKEAETAFGKFRREVGASEGAMGKFRTISGSAFDYVKANAVSFATAAATAIGAFAVKSVMAFQDLALAAGKFSDATGLSSEQASRFIEVAGDIGVEAGQVEKAIGFMNKTLGNSPELFKSLGVEIAYAADGSRDINGTFINVVDRLNQIKDPAERAAAATKLLGRGWMEMAELVGMGADELQSSLAAVADSKVIDEREVQKARDFRAATDELKDKFEELTLQVGEKLVPALTDSITLLLELGDAIGNIPVLPDILGNMLKGRPFHMAMTEAVVNYTRELMGLNTEVETGTTAFDGLNVGLADVSDKMRDASMDTEELNGWLERQIENVDTAKAKWDEYRTGLNIKAETLRIQDDIDAFRTKWAGTTDEAKLKSREYQQELIRIQTELANAALAVVGLATTAQNNTIRLLIDNGKLYEALSLINLIKARVDVAYATADQMERQLGQAGIPGGTPPPAPRPQPAPTPKAPPAPKPPTNRNVIVPPTGGGPIRRMASGGTVTAPGFAWVGEEGPELVSLPRGASVIPSIPSRRMMGGGVTINVSVQAGLVSSPDQVGQQIIEAIRRAERRSGQVFASV